MFILASLLSNLKMMAMGYSRPLFSHFLNDGKVNLKPCSRNVLSKIKRVKEKNVQAYKEYTAPFVTGLGILGWPNWGYLLLCLLKYLSLIPPPSYCAPAVNGRLYGSCSSLVFPVIMHSMSLGDAGKFSLFRVRWMVVLASELEAFPAGPQGWSTAIREVWEPLSSVGISPGPALVLRSSLISSPFLAHKGAAVSQAPNIDKTVFSPLYILASFVTD